MRNVYLGKPLWYNLDRNIIQGDYDFGNILRQKKFTRKQKISPFIVAYLQTTDSHTVEVLRIKNIGEGYAHNVQFEVIQDYKRMGKETLLLSNAIKRGISSFPPLFEVTYYIDYWSNIKNSDDYIELKISYKRIDNKKFSNTYKLPLRELAEQNYSTPPDTHMGQIAYYLREINSTLKQKSK